MRHTSTTLYNITENKAWAKYKKKMLSEGWKVIDEYRKDLKITVKFERKFPQE